ncbi:MAG: DoxX family protein [Ignavibacteria bacterium]|nr:DoxX family protein [Ignavibacteria bacterium]
MKLVSNIEDWADAHHPKWLDIIRILLGLVLIAKGISFIRDTDLMSALLLDSNAQLRSMAFAHYVIGVQLVAGFMLTFGLLTRVAAFSNPILVTAIFYMDVTKEFLLSVLNYRI